VKPANRAAKQGRCFPAPTLRPVGTLDKGWGRNGFDGNRETREACRGGRVPRKTRDKQTTANTELALAA
jgi:hypothetical protein